VARNKLLKPGTKSPVLVEEKNPRLLSEILATFCPEGGRVLDMYAGTLTTALACIDTGRRCSVVEQDVNCFRIAHDRLQKVASETLTRRGVPFMKRRKEKDNEGNVPKTPRWEADGMSVAGAHREVEDDTGNGHTEKQSSSRPEVRGGEVVSLILSNKRVGKAIVQADGEEGEGPKRRLHGEDLRTYASAEESLVVIYSVSINDEALDENYPYDFGGVEPPPAKLRDISANLVAWDANMMRIEK